VSTRNYQAVLPDAADAVGVKKSSVSRAFIEASTQELQAVLERRLDEPDLIVIYLDGLRVGKQHVICAVGVDTEGSKHVLGLREGASENTEVVVDLLEDLVARGVNPKRRRLFVIDGSQALRKAIDQVFGAQNPVQRCRAHKLRNVLGYLPKDLHEQTRVTLKAAWRLAPKDGIAKLKQYAEWLRTEHHSAAESLLEGLEEMFTVNPLGLRATLRRGLCTTNLIESVHSGVRGKLPRAARYRSADMARRWVAAALLATERKLRRLMGYGDLWMLEAVLADTQEELAVKAA
jgi:transposase-like protein